mgnify:CR=1 FL=1
MSGKKWPPPGFPLVEGRYQLTSEWSIDLYDRFARRIEDADLVLWRPGITLWIAAWNNDKHQSQADRLKSLISGASPERFDERKEQVNGNIRWSYRLIDTNDDGNVQSLNWFGFNDEGHLQIAVYFDDIADEHLARLLVDSVVDHPR